MPRLQHTVTFRLIHPGGSAAEQTFLSDAHRTLTAIPGVEDFRIHRQVSAKSDLTFQFSMHFADETAFAAYDQHPSHVAFVADRWVAEVAAFQEFDYIAV
ncbi:Dabb family protein [Microbacterium sp. GXF0217]